MLLLEEGVRFKDLGLAVIDEQHRFGVEQRQALGRKSAVVDILHMSATPIPQSLVLARHGGVAVSILAQKPAGRKAILTTMPSLDLLELVYPAIDRAVAQGVRVYWVCPYCFTELTLARPQSRG